jgi:hypothetical protein
MCTRYIVTLLTFLTVLTAYSQDTNYYYGVNDKIVGNLEAARNYKNVRKRSGKCYSIKSFSRTDGTWTLVRSEKARKKRNGIYQFRYRESTFFPRFFRRTLLGEQNGIFRFRETNRKTLLREGGSLTQIPLHLQGKVIEYRDDGSVKSESIYRENQLVSNTYWKKDGALLAENVFFNVHKPPQFLPGDRYLKDYIIHKIAEEKLPVTQIQDELLIGWVVTDKGEIGNVVILKGRVESVNNFFLETIRSLPGQWEPAELDGRKVNYFVTMPVSFTNTVPMLQNIDFAGGMLMWDY